MTNNTIKKSDEIVKTGKRVIDLESSALNELSKNLPSNFSNFVSTLLNCRGRIIVCGVGKSGHVGKKISSTLSSTGSPSFFLHPSEASHGDLGAIKRDDILFIISNSGETIELANTISYAKQRSIKVLGITADSQSTLAKKSFLSLILPKVSEACPNGLAPTTSTAMALALGDSIAICLMEQKNFSPQQFSNFHPGGTLGTKLLKVKNIMHIGESLPLIGEDKLMPEVLIKMTNKGFGVAGVINSKEKLIGIITDGDLRRNMNSLLSFKALEVMNKNPISINENTLVLEALSLMYEKKITCLFCHSSKSRFQPIGIVHIHDCLRLNKSS